MVGLYPTQSKHMFPIVVNRKAGGGGGGAGGVGAGGARSGGDSSVAPARATVMRTRRWDRSTAGGGRCGPVGGLAGAARASGTDFRGGFFWPTVAEDASAH